MPQIEDQEMRQLFRTECDERLQRLDAGWLQLEKEPSNTVLIEDLFREAHSVKGAARMLGLLDIQDLAHGMEDELGAIRKGGYQSMLRLFSVNSKHSTNCGIW